jgi:hypothetical protein
MSLYSRRWFCALSGSVRGRISVRDGSSVLPQCKPRRRHRAVRCLYGSAQGHTLRSLFVEVPLAATITLRHPRHLTVIIAQPLRDRRADQIGGREPLAAARSDPSVGELPPELPPDSVGSTQTMRDQGATSVHSCADEIELSGISGDGLCSLRTCRCALVNLLFLDSPRRRKAAGAVPWLRCPPLLLHKRS